MSTINISLLYSRFRWRVFTILIISVIISSLIDSSIPRTNGQAKTEISRQIIRTRMIGVKPADFNPEDDGVICNPRGNPINYVWMGESEMPGDE
ncbi:MAG: hypothetical protein WBF33_27745, partial [Candidatus Nitrosopolaris sp.]